MTNVPQIRVFGGLYLPSQVELSSRQQDVVSILIGARNDGISVQDLVSVLWSARPPPSARVMVHQALGGIRRVLPPSVATLDKRAQRYYWSETANSDYALLLDVATTVRSRLPVSEHVLLEVLGHRVGQALPAGFGPQIDDFRGLVDHAYLDILKAGVELVSDNGLDILRRHLQDAVSEFPLDTTLRRGLLDVSTRIGEPFEAQRTPDKTDAASLRMRLFGVPGYLTEFVGRSDELSHLATLVGSKRLVTLLGPAGIGKSRIAVEFVNTISARSTFAAAVFVDCANIADQVDLHQQILRSVGTGQRSMVQGPPEVEAALRAVSNGRRVLLVLDNYETSGQAGGLLIGQLGSTWPELAFLATSQRRVGIDGEATLRVSAMSPSDAVRLAIARLEGIEGLGVADPAERFGEQIATEFGGVPLSIEIVAGIIRDHGSTPSSADVVSIAVPRFSGRSEHDRLSTAMRWAWERLTFAEQDTLMAITQFSRPVVTESIAVVSLSSSVHSDVHRLVALSLVSVNETVIDVVDSVRRFGRFKTRRSPTGPSLQTRFAEHLLANLEDRPFHELLLSAPVVETLDELLTDLRVVFASLLDTNRERALGLFERLVGVWWQGDRHIEAAGWAQRLWPTGVDDAEASLSNVAIALRQQDWDVALAVLQRQRESPARSERIVANSLLAAASYTDPDGAWSLLAEATSDLQIGSAVPALEGVVALMRGELMLLEDKPTEAAPQFRLALHQLEPAYSWWVGVAALGLLASSINDSDADIVEAVVAMSAASVTPTEEPRLVLARVIEAMVLGRLGLAKRLLSGHLKKLCNTKSADADLLEALAVCTPYFERVRRPEMAKRTRRTLEATFDRWTTPWIRGLLGPPTSDGPNPKAKLAVNLQAVATEVLSVLDRHQS